MRIIAGRHRGLQLADLGAGDPASHLRATPDRVREAMFNLLAGGRFDDPLTGAHLLAPLALQHRADRPPGSGAPCLNPLSAATHP